jgi:hypothetical protein
MSIGAQQPPSITQYGEDRSGDSSLHRSLDHGLNI